MLDYKRLKTELKNVLSKMTDSDIKDWLKFDKERINNENAIKHGSTKK